MQKAMIGWGEWRLIPSYKLEVPESSWFRKTLEPEEQTS